jgi:type II secretory pathway component PulM
MKWLEALRSRLKRPTRAASPASLGLAASPAVQQLLAKWPAGQLGRWWAQRPPRERWMLLGGFIAAVLVGLDTLWTAPMEKRLRRANAELVTREESVQKAAQQPAGPNAEELQRLRDQEAALRARLQAAQAAAAQMGQQTSELPQLLRTLTGQGGASGSLKLVSLELLPDPALMAPPGASVPAASEPAGATPATIAIAGAQRRLYRLPVSLTVSGSYDDLQRLMQNIERDAPSLQWVSLSLDSSDWPAIKLTLRAQAVSLRPTWSSAS